MDYLALRSVWCLYMVRTKDCGCAASHCLRSSLLASRHWPPRQRTPLFAEQIGFAQPFIHLPPTVEGDGWVRRDLSTTFHLPWKVLARCCFKVPSPSAYRRRCWLGADSNFYQLPYVAEEAERLSTAFMVCGAYNPPPPHDSNSHDSGISTALIESPNTLPTAH